MGNRTSPRAILHLSHRERSICVANRVRGYGVFRSPYPLTPTLSPWERGRTVIVASSGLGEAMFVNRRDVQIQWGDCDPANIVYYPRYFAMFDDSTSILFEAAGFSKQDIIKKYGLVGIPMVDTRAKFHIASTHGDWITIESRVESFKRSSFEVTHKVFKGDALAIEAFETRVLVGRHPDDPARLKSAAVPAEIVTKFMQS